MATYAGWTRTGDMKPIAITPLEACEMLSIGMTKFYDLVGQKEIDVFKIGRATRVTTESIHAYVERRLSDARAIQRSRAMDDLISGDADLIDD